MRDADGREVHEDVHQLLLLGQPINLLNVVVGKEWVLIPVGVVKPQSDVIGQHVVPQQQLQLRIERAMVEIVWALPSQNVLCPLGEQPLEAHIGDGIANFVIVDEGRVAEYLRLLTEVFLDLLHL